VSRPLVLAVALACATSIPAGALAAGVDQLRAFLDGTRSARAEFRQSVVSRSSGKSQQASGSMSFVRPGKFRWTYEKPYHQLLVGDGEKLWIYDKDLSQVTVKTLGEALGSSPAALLAGDNALEKNFRLENDSARDGLEFVLATPKQQEAGFEQVRIGFAGNLPRVMELTDNFGQVTTLQFVAFERNPKLDPGQFRFAPPAGADVVGE
jgi:outer membrane lipoprotein carrier protein